MAGDARVGITTGKLEQLQFGIGFLRAIEETGAEFGNPDELIEVAHR